MSASAWFNEYQAAACPACAGDDRAIHIHEACALKAQTDLREALAEAREEVERLTGVVAGASDDVRDAAKEWRYWNARALAAERARDEAVKAYRRAADALGWAREIGADEVAQYAALAPEETALDDTGREEFRAGVLAAANYLVSISVPGHISAQFILDLAAGIRALPTPVVEDDECGFCLRPMRERNTKCLLCSPPAPAEQEVGRCPAEGSPTEAGRCHKCGCVVEPSPCHCGKSHTGTYCWPCHHKNVRSCAAPHCPEHGAAAAQAWLDGQDPAPSPEAPARCPECEGTRWFSPTRSHRDGWPCKACGGTGTKGGGKP